MAQQNTKITPNCRYGHGDLVRVVPESDSMGDMNFGFNAARHRTLMFTGELFICGVCGYTEFFDNEPEITISHNIAKKDRNGNS